MWWLLPKASVQRAKPLMTQLQKANDTTLPYAPGQNTYKSLSVSKGGETDPPPLDMEACQHQIVRRVYWMGYNLPQTSHKSQIP